MRSVQGDEKPHVVCVPYPSQSHINPSMKLAKLLHFHGFHVTFVLTNYNYARLLRSRGPSALDGLPSFRFTSFPDGLPESNANVTQDIPSLCASLDRNCIGPFTDLLKGLNKAGDDGSAPRVSCILADLAMPFTLEAAEALGMKIVMFWCASACGLFGYHQFSRLQREGYTPLKDGSYLTNGYLDTPIDWIPAMKGIRLKDMPSFVRTTDPKDIMFHYVRSMAEKSRKAAAIIFVNSYDALEHDVLASLATEFPPLYPLGPVHILENLIDDEDETKSIGSNLWKQDYRCIQWLDSKDPGSVLFVNFGSISVITRDELVELAFGLAKSGKHFLWIIRPDVVLGDSAILPKEFSEETKDRSYLSDWCDQESVLRHPAIGGFLTHSGWNSTIESVCNGVPMISWPRRAEQPTNCWSLWNVWGIGVEIDSHIKRENVERQVRELMDGEKGKEMKRKVMEWKMLAEKAVAKGNGDSWMNLDKLMTQVLIS